MTSQLQCKNVHIRIGYGTCIRATLCKCYEHSSAAWQVPTSNSAIVS